ncbi:2OG-Fe(II) oxygenase [Lysobacter xanthus]
MINEGLDVAAMRDALRQRGRVQVDDFLDPAVARRLRDCLEHEVPWTLAVRDDAGARTIRGDEYARLQAGDMDGFLRGVADGDGFRFAYESYMMVRAYTEGLDPGLVLHRVLESLNSPSAIGFYRAVTGDERIRRAGAQATRYRRGHFLRQHNDEDAAKERRFAYVINLTRDWQADWGGLLQFVDRDGRVVDSFVPRWNTLSLFEVPADHVVSLVAPWARQDRLSITGWWSL